MKILIVTAHPHYAAQYCAGTIVNHSLRGDEVYVLSLTAGELMTDAFTQEELKRINKADMNKAGGILGVKEITILDFPDTTICNNDEVRLAINDEIRRVKPDTVITHWPNDTHPDFRETGLAVIDACFFALVAAGKWAQKYKAHWINRLYAFEAPKLSVGFEPDYFVDITSSMDKKIEALKVFKVHYDANFGGNAENWCSEVTGANRRWGAESGVLYAEPYRQLKVHEIHNKAFNYIP